MLKKIWQPTALFIGIVAVWEIAVRVLNVPDYLVPPPSQIMVTLWDERAYFMENLPTTLLEVVVGTAIGIVIGIVLAIPSALTPFGRNAVMPLVVATNSIPKPALAPIFVVWFGFGLEPKILIVVLVTFFPVVVSMAQGLESVEPELVQYMKTLGARPTKIFRLLRFPTALPALFAGLKVAVPAGVVAAIFAEFINASSGLGFVILRSLNQFNTSLTFAGIIVVSALGVLLYLVVVVIERRALRWNAAIAGR